MSSGLRSQASNEGQGGGQNPLALQADFSQGIAVAVQEQVARAVSDVSTQLSTGLDKRIDQLDQRAEKRDAERRADAVCAAKEAAEEQATRFKEILASIATQNTGGAQLGVLSSANPVVPLVPPVLGVSSPEPESSVPVVVFGRGVVYDRGPEAAVRLACAASWLCYFVSQLERDGGCLVLQGGPQHVSYDVAWFLEASGDDVAELHRAVSVVSFFRSACRAL